MAEKNAILPYLDIPLQHAHPDVLQRMRRPSDMQSVRATLGKIRAAMPDAALRTTFIVGFPGETEAEFQALLDFVDEIRFDHVGIFPYYHEADTAALI
jgi:ribosomal protein S12 methylthiotransferase